jgi:hypothetical protein
MSSTAIIIGNASYAQLTQLPCCREDAEAIRALVEATGRFDAIHPYTDLNGNEMREAIRQALPTDRSYEEIFFYFSGHGGHVEGEYYYSGTGFNHRKPNETGLSQTDLHDLVRVTNPSLVVKIIDACESGTLLVKADRQPPLLPKDAFRHFVQFSSSLSDQSSLTGAKLSPFTRVFLDASMRKAEGVVYYSDINTILRDAFIENDNQTPHVLYQGTGREVLIDDAAKLAPFRKTFESRWAERTTIDSPAEGDTDLVVAEPTAPATARELLIAAEGKMGNRDKANALIDPLFDGVIKRFRNGEFGEFFEYSSTEHATYVEPTVRDFMIRVLSRESRPDNFVTAAIKRDRKRASPWGAMTEALVMMDPNWTEQYDLELNCSMDRVQLRLTLTPHFQTLQRLVLVLSCAPSLERLYLFEMVTQHSRSDWDTFDSDGREVVRNWYRLDWGTSVSNLIEKICAALEDAIRKHIEETTARVAK